MSSRDDADGASMGIRSSEELATYQQAAKSATTFADRVREEKAELDARLGKLMAFFSTPIYAGLSEAERSRLRAQSFFMVGYSSMLGERIAAF